MVLIIFTWIVISGLVGILGRTSTWGGWIIFLISLFCSPVLATLVCFLTQKPKKNNKTQLNEPTVYKELQTSDYGWEDKATLLSYATALLNNNFISEHSFVEIRDKIMMRDDTEDRELLNNLNFMQKQETSTETEINEATRQKLIVSLLILGFFVIALLLYLYYNGSFNV